MKKIVILLVVLIVSIFNGCVQNIQNISANGLTLRVSADELSSNIADSFPIVKNLPYGSIELSNPKAILKKGSNKIVAGTTITYENDNLPTQQGKLYISGSPYFNAQTGEIFLRTPKIEKMSFNGIDLFDYVKQPLIDKLQPIINNIFAHYPIYRVDKSKFINSYIKNIYVDDGLLLITFGL